jgi:predicted PurR-regulated permease PerM
VVVAVVVLVVVVVVVVLVVVVVVVAVVVSSNWKLQDAYKILQKIIIKYQKYIQKNEPRHKFFRKNSKTLKTSE